MKISCYGCVLQNKSRVCCTYCLLRIRVECVVRSPMKVECVVHKYAPFRVSGREGCNTNNIYYLDIFPNYILADLYLISIMKRRPLHISRHVEVIYEIVIDYLTKTTCVLNTQVFHNANTRQT